MEKAMLMRFRPSSLIFASSTLQQQRLFPINSCRSSFKHHHNHVFRFSTSSATTSITPMLYSHGFQRAFLIRTTTSNTLGPTMNPFRVFPFCAFSSSTTDNGNTGQKQSEDAGDADEELDLTCFEGYYFDGEIPRNRIYQKLSRASGPGGMNINANSTKAEIRFQLSDADWIPERVRDRMAQKHAGNMNNRGELRVTSMRTRSSVENMDDCFDKLGEMLREASQDLVKERRRQFIEPEQRERIERRKEQADQWRLAMKKRHSEKKKNRRVSF